MRKFKLYYLFALVTLFCVRASAQYPENPYKAPLYWDVYENNFLKEKQGVADNYISEDEFLANINWVATNLKQYGYNMICIDGWGNVDYDQYGYRTKHSRHWAHDYAWWSSELQKRGMTLGIYDNPLWVSPAAADAGVKVKGTNIPLSTLINKSENATWFTWLQVDRPGAEEYVKGFVQHYADMGVKYLRVDFLSWFESGWDRNMGTVGPKRPLSYYQMALRWMREACDANGIFLSLVMPNLYNDAVTEQTYGHMIRINEDCAEGAWERFSNIARGAHREGWSQFANPFDGFIYWSQFSGKGKIILDGDFIRLNTFANDNERKSAVSLHLMAGGPVSIADQYNTIGTSLSIYQNAELLALNSDGFVGKPLSNDPTNALSQVWKGQMSNGDWIVGFFNRENESQNRSIDFQNDLGIAQGHIRDLWSHTDLGLATSSSESIPAHGCRIYRITHHVYQADSPIFSQEGGSYDHVLKLTLTTSTEGAVIYYTTDGSEPSPSSNRYTGPILLTASAVLKAMAVKDGIAYSFVASEGYVINPVQQNESMYVAGDFSGWALPQNSMQYIGNNDWKSNNIYFQKGTYEFKFADTPDWTVDDWGNASGTQGAVTLTTGGAPNGSFNILEAGTYFFRFNESTLDYSIEKAESSLLRKKENDSDIQIVQTGYKSFFIQNTGASANVNVYNCQGKSVYSEQNIRDRQLINLTGWPSGCYLVQVHDGEIQKTDKILLK